MSLFKEKEKITRREFRKALARRNPILPGTYKKLFSVQEKKFMEKRLFGKRINAQTSQEKYKKLVREIGKEKYKVRDFNQKRIIDKKIRFLKRLGGI